MSSNERRLQTHGVSWLKMALPEIMVIAVINELTRFGGEDEAKTAMIRMQMMKAAGLYPGCADLILLWNDGALQIRFLETKDKSNQSVNQKAFQARLESLGGSYSIWRSLPELEALCRSWGLKPAAPTPKGEMPLTRKQLQANMLHELRLEMSKNEDKN